MVVLLALLWSDAESKGVQDCGYYCLADGLGSRHHSLSRHLLLCELTEDGATAMVKFESWMNWSVDFWAVRVGWRLCLLGRELTCEFVETHLTESDYGADR